jgi:phosphohistidine phosphatase
MKLYVMRHGPAEDRSEAVAEFDRQLTAKGREQTAAAARGLSKLGVQPAAILSSPLVRCAQTAELATAALANGSSARAVDALAAGASPGEMLKVIRQHASADVMVVGHDPDVSRLVSYLLDGGSQPFVSFSKGGVVALEARGRPEAEGCRLLWYLRRKQLAALAEIGGAGSQD